MISSHFEAMVTTLLPAEEFILFRRSDLTNLPAHTQDRFLTHAEKALRSGLNMPALADWLAGPAQYDSLRAQNRRDLAALCLGEAVRQNGRYLASAAQLLFAILCEPSWNRAGRRAVPAMQAAPDAFAAETAELIAWAALLLDRDADEYAIGLRESAYQACEERVLRYLDDPAVCEAALRRTDAPVFARATAAACLFTPQNESVRWLRLKNALRIADRCASGGWFQSAFAREGLRGWIESACAVSDAVLLADLACAGQSGLRSDESLIAEMRLPVQLHIDGEYFADEKSHLRPGLSGEDLYRIGATFDDDALCSLGARLDRAAISRGDMAAGSIQNNITACMLSALWRPSLENDPGNMSAEPTAQMQSLSFYAARPHGGKGFYTALVSGALVLFLDGEPVLTLADQGAEGRSLPEPDLKMQSRPSVRDISLRTDGFPTISMDIAPSFPLDASLASWQRTVMLTNHDQTVRLLDAFDYAGTRKISRLRFVSPHMPVVAVGAPRARIGTANIEWDGPTNASIEQIDEKHWALILAKGDMAAGGCWTCTFTRSESIKEHA